MKSDSDVGRGRVRPVNRRKQFSELIKELQEVGLIHCVYVCARVHKFNAHACII